MATEQQRFGRLGSGVNHGGIALREELGQFLAQFLAQL
jgi:hypothetical protein